jgi:hypothetical protein
MHETAEPFNAEIEQLSQSQQNERQEIEHTFQAELQKLAVQQESVLAAAKKKQAELEKAVPELQKVGPPPRRSRSPSPEGYAGQAAERQFDNRWKPQRTAIEEAKKRRSPSPINVPPHNCRIYPKESPKHRRPSGSVSSRGNSPSSARTRSPSSPRTRSPSPARPGESSRASSPSPGTSPSPPVRQEQGIDTSRQRHPSAAAGDRNGGQPLQVWAPVNEMNLQVSGGHCPPIDEEDLKSSDYPALRPQRKLFPPPCSPRADAAHQTNEPTART